MKVVIAVLWLIATISATLVDGLNHHQSLEPNGPLADNQGASLDSVNLMDDHLQPESPPHPYLFRLPRRRRNAADDPLTSAVERMQMIARLTNVIYLQKALINGAISPDTLISELLHFGPVSPAQIDQMNMTQIEDALTVFKDMPGKLVFDDELKKLETFYENVSSLLEEVKGIEDMKTWPEKDIYKKDIESLKAARDFKFFADLRSFLNGWSTFQKDVSNADINALTVAEETYIDILGDYSGNLIEAGQNLTKELPKLFEFTGKKTAYESVRFVDQVTKGAQQVKEKDLVVPAGGYKQLKSNLDQVSNAVKSAKPAESSSQIIADMFSSRTTQNDVKLPTYTISLRNGYEDITRMLGYFNNLWFSRTVKDERLKDSFKSLDSLVFANVIVMQLEKNGGSQQRKETMSTLVSIMTKLDKIFSAYSMENAEQIKDCFHPRAFFSADNATLLVTKAVAIDEEMDLLRSSIESLKTSLSNADLKNGLQKLVKVQGLLKPNDDASLKTAYSEFKKIKNFDAIKKKVEDIEDTAQKVRIDKLQELATESEPLFAAVDEFLTDAALPIRTLDCLRNKPSTIPTIQVIKESKNLRVKKDDHEAAIDDALVAMRAVVATKKDLKSLDSIIKGIKNFESKESNLLNLFKSSTEVYQTIGPAVRGIESMKLAIDLESKIQVIKSEFATVTSELANAKDQLSPADVTLLNNFPTLEASLDRMYPRLKKWASDVQNMRMNSLSDYSVVFEKAMGVVGINEDLGAIGKSLEKLIDVAGPQNKNKLKMVKEALDSLDGMGTLFASCSKNFNDSKKSLTELEMFFSSFAKTISVTLPPPTAPPSSNSRYGSVGNSSKQKEEAEGMSTGTIIGIIVAFGIALLLIAGLSFVLYRRYCKTKGKPEEEEKVVTENSAPLQTTTDSEHMSRYIRVFMKELINHENNFVLVDGRKWNIDCNAVLDGKHNLHSNAMPDFRNVFSDYFYAWCEKIHKSVDADLKKNNQKQYSLFVNEHIREVRKNAELMKKSRVVIQHGNEIVHFETDFLHANYVQEQNYFLMMLTQGPQNATPDGSKISTMEKFWFVVYENKLDAILMLCRIFESNKGIEEKMCDEYFPFAKDETLVVGKFTIKCIAIINNKFFIERKLTVIVAGQEKPHILTHFQYINWPDESVPDEVTNLGWWGQERCREGPERVQDCHQERPETNEGS